MLVMKWEMNYTGGKSNHNFFFVHVRPIPPLHFFCLGALHKIVYAYVGIILGAENGSPLYNRRLRRLYKLYMHTKKRDQNVCTPRCNFFRRRRRICFLLMGRPQKNAPCTLRAGTIICVHKN